MAILTVQMAFFGHGGLKKGMGQGNFRSSHGHNHHKNRCIDM
jgi:hypothetical protein